MGSSIKIVGAMVIDTPNGTVAFQIGTEDERIASLLENIGDMALIAQWQANLARDENIHQRLAASELADKTPAQIIAYIEGSIDRWRDIQDAKRDMKLWLPIIAVIANFLIERENK